MIPALWLARLRLAALAVAWFARALADCLLASVLLLFPVGEGRPPEPTLAAVGLLALAGCLPAILLVPIFGPAAAPGRRGVTLLAACLAGMLAFPMLLAEQEQPTAIVVAVDLALVVASGITFRAAGWALVPSVTARARVSPVRLAAGLEFAAFAGVMVALNLVAIPGSALLPVFVLAPVLALALAAPAGVGFDPPGLVGDPATNRRPWYIVALDPAVRGHLFGLATLTGLTVLAALAAADGGPLPNTGLLALALGLAAGGLVGGVQPHPYRAGAFVPLGLVGLAIITAIAGPAPGSVLPALLSGLCLGLARAPLRSAVLGAVRPTSAGTAGGLLVAATASGLLLGGGLAFVVLAGVNGRPLDGSMLLADFLRDPPGLSPAGLLTLAAAGSAVVALGVGLRPLTEQLVEVPLWCMYRVTATGPGLTTFPRTGPVVVLANHSAWFDPFWLAKVLPRPVTPMLTSRFFDVWWIRLLLTHVVPSVRVQQSRYRREAPELAEAVAALDRGEVLVMFPEGALQRAEGVPPRRFGRGVWEVLRRRPGTPVVACWIEGGWGSFTSYCNGPPASGKRPDVRRPIRIAVTEPEVLDEFALDDHHTTREYLREAVRDARLLLGLSPVGEDEPEEPDDDPAEA